MKKKDLLWIAFLVALCLHALGINSMEAVADSDLQNKSSSRDLKIGDIINQSSSGKTENFHNTKDETDLLEVISVNASKPYHATLINTPLAPGQAAEIITGVELRLNVKDTKKKGVTSRTLLPKEDLLDVSDSPSNISESQSSTTVSTTSVKNEVDHQNEGSGMTDFGSLLRAVNFSVYEDNENESANTSTLLSIENELRKSVLLNTATEGNQTAENIKYFSLLLQRNCSTPNTPSSSLAALETSLLSLLNFDIGAGAILDPIGCKSFYHVQYAVRNISESSLKSALNALSENYTLGGDFKLIEAFEYNRELDEDAFLKYWLRERVQKHFLLQTDLPYIIIALSVGFLLLLFIAFFCVRCSTHKHTKSMDLCDIPHLNLKLEDYKITPIPRPSLTYQECNRELLNSSYGRSHSTNEGQHFSVDEIRHPSVSGGPEFRTFDNRKLGSRAELSGVRPEKKVAQWMGSSREELRSAHERQRLNGIDNACFQTWH